jgi:hypothetical protein
MIIDSKKIIFDEDLLETNLRVTKMKSFLLLSELK